MTIIRWQFLHALLAAGCVLGLAAPCLALATPGTGPAVTLARPAPGTPAVQVSPAFDGRVVALQPFGVVDAALLLATARVLHHACQVDVQLLPARALPRRAFYAARHRYRGDRLIDDLEAHTPATFAKVLGITASDLSVTNGRIFDWGVLGVAGLAGRAAVVSTWRMRRGASPDLVRRRLEQVATHELGHTYGLPHCDTPGCIMNDAKGTIRVVDGSSGSFCPRCRRRLELAMRNASATPGSVVAPKPVRTDPAAAGR